MLIGKFGAVLGFTASIAACEQQATTGGFPGTSTFVVTGHGTDHSNAICQGFRLSEAQARKFFLRSEPITAKTLHDEYDYLPCWVEGKMVRSGETYTWKIRPIGIGEIRHRDGFVELRGCKKCADLFK